ncbi:hypothetical protein K432DRAFT_385588 [Lepidopterella palustris CBS 459.81]|uniref:Uncharacterized protein n=1 Tax=Lepidopterella palustris CBS 459.81 TaxID=1314670 RepID=A0A8E2E2M7_9PEZI|nr:hypothetical protein K432DRAFT_385588 [Lepidopterella palustris CBS 459.81]
MWTTTLGDDEYEALSYTWRSAWGPRQITVDGKPFSVTRNLERRHRHLRLPEELQLHATSYN